MRVFLYQIYKISCSFGRVKAPNFNDRKRHCIDLILCLLRSLKFGSFHAGQTATYFVYLVLFIIFIIPSLLFSKNERSFVVNLKNPVYQDGVLTTVDGGVISSDGIRIQAQKIIYTNRIENGVQVQKVEASGDLMIEYGKRYFVGTKLEYDLIKQTGMLYEGKTFIDLWYMGGEKIALKPDQSFNIYGAFITTSESQNTFWDVHTPRVKISKERILSCKSVRFRFFKFPIFWLPSLRMNLKFLADPPIRYKLDWDKGQGPRVSMRYRIYSWDLFTLYLRLDYRLKRGPGGAIESDYESEDKRKIFKTKSYFAHDTSIKDPHELKNRYRFQGLAFYESINQKTTMRMVWDKISDRRMPEDFKSVDFEINTAKRTQLLFRNETPAVITGLNYRPRINNWQGFKQEVPTILGSLHPFIVGRSGIISENRLRIAYLDYVYAAEINDVIPDFHSGRFEIRNQIYRPFKWNPFIVTPFAGFTGLVYTNNPHEETVAQGIFCYGARANTFFFKNYNRRKHGIEPYLVYEGLTSPQTPSNKVFIFDINDGYHRLNLLKVGVRNSIFSLRSRSFLPKCVLDLYTYGFFADETYSRTFPKGFMSLTLNFKNLAITSLAGWNFEENVFEVGNIKTDWTINEDFAFSLEIRHRSRFYWRKDNYDNFILDVARSIESLRHSPLSDQRNTALARASIRLSPQWIAQIQAHYGWGRKTEPSYYETKIDLITMLTSSWKARITYQHTVDDDRFTGAISLVKY